MTGEEKIRKFETEILDEVYTEEEFYKYSDDIIIPYLLQAYGDINRHREGLLAHGFTEISLSFYLSNMLHGIGHCIRWAKKQTNPQYFVISTPQLAQQLSMDFINWGTTYHTIAQEFVTWSRKLKSATLNEQNNTITFGLPDEYDYSMVLGLQLLYRKQIEDIYESYPHEQMEKEFVKWVKEMEPLVPPIFQSMNWTKARYSEVYPILLRKFEELIFPELLGSSDLLGYSLEQLRQFYTLFFLNFYFINWIEISIDTKHGVNHSFGSNPLYLIKDQFIMLASLITDLDQKTCENIIRDFTFDTANFHSSISIQPFITSKSGTYYVLPNLISLLEPSRMIAGAFNKGEKKRVYDTLINQIQEIALDKLGNSLTKYTTWPFQLDKLIITRGKRIKPDLIIIDVSSNIILIADYKHYVGPITSSEVEYKIKELKKGIDQVNGYIDTVSSLDQIGGINIDGYKIYGMIITHKPLPIPIPLSNDLLITDSRSFIDYLTKKNGENLEQFISVFKNKKPAYKSEFDCYEVDEEIKVKNWTIIRKMFKAKK